MSKVFVKPNDKKRQYGRVQHLSAIEPPVWLALMAKADADSVVIDMEAEGLDEAGLLLRLRGLSFDEIVLLATGSHPSAHIQQTEAAARVKKAVSVLFDVPVNVFSHLPIDPTRMGEIPFEKLSMDLYRAHNWHSWGRKDRSYGATFSSISCPFKCGFCCVKDFYRSEYCRRDPHMVLADVKALVDKGITNIKMMDELFALEHQGAREVCALLAGEGLGEIINIWAYARIDTVTEASLQALRRAGVRWLAYGIESGNPMVRSSAMKGKFTNDQIRHVIRMTKDADINIVGNYMFGFWEDTLATMQETFELAQDLNCEYANFYGMSVYPGSKLYDEMMVKGIDLPRTGTEFAQMSPDFKPVPTAVLSGREVLAFRDKAFNEYFTSERYVSMMNARFGMSVVDEIRAMTAINIREKI